MNMTSILHGMSVPLLTQSDATYRMPPLMQGIGPHCVGCQLNSWGGCMAFLAGILGLAHLEGVLHVRLEHPASHLQTHRPWSCASF
jgi:hypothetical protein